MINIFACRTSTANAQRFENNNVLSLVQHHKSRAGLQMEDYPAIDIAKPGPWQLPAQQIFLTFLSPKN